MRDQGQTRVKDSCVRQGFRDVQLLADEAARCTSLACAVRLDVSSCALHTRSTNMPGLLQTQAEHFTKSKYVMALCAEFLGSCLFSFTGSALLSVALANPEEPNVVMAALGNGAGIAIAGEPQNKHLVS